VDVLGELRAAEDPRLVVDLEGHAPASVALLSGSFDPVTLGHLGVAEAALGAGAGLVVLVYAVSTLPKDPGAPEAWLAEEDRIRALEAVCRSRGGLVVGLASHGLITDQVRAARRRFPGSALTVLVGSDKAVQLLDPGWYADRDPALERLFAEADVRYVVRAGGEAAIAEAFGRARNERWARRFAPLRADPALAGVSSRLVRERLGRGEDVSALVPAEALPFLKR